MQRAMQKVRADSTSAIVKIAESACAADISTIHTSTRIIAREHNATQV